MRRRRLRSAIVMGLAWVVAAGGEVLWADGIRATINRAEATVEDQLLLTLTVEGSRSAEPVLPDLEDFDVYPRGQSTQMSFVNGRVTSSVSYNFVLVPKRTGSFTIGAASVELDGEVYESQPITVQIVGAEELPEQPRDLFLSAKVSTTRPFVGQQVVYIWRFYRRVRIGDARLEPQDFSGFLVEDLGEVREYQATVNGVQYLVSEIRKALFPQEAGVQMVPASRLGVEVLVRSSRRQGPDSMFDDFFGRTSTETKTLRSRPIELDVQPLPDAPTGFTGLVGDFEVAAEISKATLQVGETTTLKLTVRGTGNVQMIAEPRLPELADFKIYDDKPAGSVDRTGSRLAGTRAFSKALVPLRPGELVIPPARLVYFDPQSAQFQEIATSAIALSVAPADGKEDLNLTESLAPTTGKVAVRILADDLLPIYRGLDAVDGRGRTTDRWLLAAGILMPPLVFAATLGWARRRQRFARDAGLRRRHRALRRLRSDLREATDPESASRCLRRYIGDKLGHEGSALTATEIDSVLREHGLAEELASAVRNLLGRLEAAQYGGDSLEASTAVGEIEALVKKLERQVGR